MKTITVTDARKNLSSWLKRASAGEEIGIINGADVIELRPVAVTSSDRATAAQIETWKKLAGRWKPDLSLQEEINAIYEARSQGRTVAL